MEVVKKNYFVLGAHWQYIYARWVWKDLTLLTNNNNMKEKATNSQTPEQIWANHHLNLIFIVKVNKPKWI